MTAMFRATGASGSNVNFKTSDCKQRRKDSVNENTRKEIKGLPLNCFDEMLQNNAKNANLLLFLFQKWLVILYLWVQLYLSNSFCSRLHDAVTDSEVDLAISEEQNVTSSHAKADKRVL